MHRSIITAILISLVLHLTVTIAPAQDQSEADVDAINVADTDWPWWRGPNRNGIAASNQSPPLEWSESLNVIWQTSIPGRGHGSITVVGNRVFLATAEEKRELQSVLCYDRHTGKRLWKTDVHRGKLDMKGNQKASRASSSVACDGHRVFINFVNAGAVYTTALDLDGKQLWQTKISDYITHQGYGSSPAIYKSLVIVSADNKGGGAVAALNRATGKIVWKHLRPKTPNYSSPIILNVAGRDQLLMTGCNLVSSLEPLTGKSIWEMAGATTECVTSTVTDGKHIITSGGYPKNHVSAILADGSGKVVWENKTRVYVPSLLIHDGFLYAVTDAGVAVCWKSDTGAEQWKHRLGGTFSGSPILAGGHLFATNESGRTFVFQANPKEFKLVAENNLGDEVYSTPTICGGRVYLRVAVRTEGQREERLYCLGKSR